jgi:hypothetical protein
MYSTGNSNQAIARHPRWVHARTIRALLTGLLGVLLAYETTVPIAASDGLCWPRD